MLGQRHRLGKSLVRWTYSTMRVSKSESLIALTVDSLIALTVDSVARCPRPGPLFTRLIVCLLLVYLSLENYTLTATSSKITSPDSNKKSITADYSCYPTFVSDNRYHCGDVGIGFNYPPIFLRDSSG